MRMTLTLRHYRFGMLAVLAMAASLALAQPPRGKPGSIAIAADGITYFAKAGDTLMSVAQQYSSRRDNWPQLARLNRIDRDQQIPIGAAIVIPADLLADEAADARVVALFGNVTAGSDGRADALALGATVREGMEIATGANSFLTLALPDMSRVSLPSNSRVRLAKLRVTRYTKSPRTDILLVRGKVESRVAPLEAVRGSFEIHTPQSVAGVRGTHFRVGIAGNTVVNEVLSGTVAVSDAARGTAVRLDGGYGNAVRQGAVGAPVALLPAPQPATPAIELADARLVLLPVAGAASYHVQLSTDPDAQNVVAERYSASPEVTIDGVRDGRYFVQMSAIDRAGIEGLSQILPLSLHASRRLPQPQANGLPAPYVEQSDAKTITLRLPAARRQQMTLQLARDAKFSWLLHTVTTDAAQVTLPRPDFGTYYARVQPVDANGIGGAFSATQTIIVTDHWVLNDSTPVKDRDDRAAAR